MDTPFTPFMRDLEERFKQASGLPNRAYYKIFYCQVKEAPILTLGINPGGAPSNTNPDGRTHKDGVVAAASASYFEHDEHDILDCEWRENLGLRAVLTPLVGGELSAIRRSVVKTNMAFHRSAKKKDIDIDRSMDETAPFLAEIIKVVKPRIVVLTGVQLMKFTSRFASNVIQRAAPERDPGVKQVVFAACTALLRPTGKPTVAVQLAHASQFGWTYERYQVAGRIRAIEA
jgi:hypothetical protein